MPPRACEGGLGGAGAGTPRYIFIDDMGCDVEGDAPSTVVRRGVYSLGEGEGGMFSPALGVGVGQPWPEGVLKL